MSYQNPLIIQNNPGGNIGQAANKAATSIQDAILFNMAKQEKKQEEIAKKQAIDDANAIAAAKESSTEEADARKALNANEYSAGGMRDFGLSSEAKYAANQIVSNVNATREERLAAQERINAENTFQQNQVGALAYFSEDKAELATLRKKGNVYSMEGLGNVYVRFLDGDPNVKLSGKRVGNDWVNTLTEDGVTYELPTDKIKDGSFEAFALTPDLYDGVDAQAKEINAARNKREKGMREFTSNDLSGITEAVNVNIDKAAANFDSYLKMDPIKARAVLSNSVYPEKTQKDIDLLMNDLQAGGIKGATAQIKVREELKKDIEYKWGMNTGVFRNDNGEFEVMKQEEKDGNGYKFAAEYTDADLNKQVNKLIAGIPKKKTEKNKQVDFVMDLLNISDGMSALSGENYKVRVIKGNVGDMDDSGKYPAATDDQQYITIIESKPGDNVDKKDVYDITNASSLTNLILMTQGYGKKNKLKARKVANKIISNQKPN